MKKIQFYAKENGFTGLTKEIVTLINALSDIYNIEIVFLNETSTTPYTISKKVSVKYINKFKLNFIEKNKIKKVIDDYKPNIIIYTDLYFEKVIPTLKDITKIYWDHSETEEVFNKLKVKKANKVIFANKNIYELNKSNESKYIPDGLNIDKNVMSDLKSKNLTFIGKLTENKCLDELLEVMSLIRKEDKEINLSIIGEGPEKGSAVKKAKELRLGLSVSFLGEISEDEKKDVLIDSTIYISTSKSNSFGISILEAMSYGNIPIIFDETTNNNEIVKNDLNGYVIKNNDINEMKEKVISIINNDELRNNLGNCAKETSIIYDINNIKSEWIKILK